jgi:hypothetical protein
VWVIIPVKSHREAVEMDAVALFGVPFGFLDLSHQSIIHYVYFLLSI